MATTISSTSAGGITTQGVGSGLDIAAIVDKLVSVESIPLNNLKSKEAAYQTKLSAYSAARGALASFQTSVASLAKPTAFSSFTANINDATLASVAVDSTKTQSLSAGTHTLRVDRLASAQRTASSAVADPAAAVGTGTLTIDIGSWDSGYTTFTPNAAAGSKTITIDGTNNSLAGIRDAINGAGAGVTASIINDGSGNRLVVSGAATGTAQGFRLTTRDGDGNDTDAAGLSQVAFDPGASGGTPQTQHLVDALNANFSIDGLPVSKPDNHVTDAIDGLTLDLKKVDASATAFTIARDTTTAKTNVNAFVAAYNSTVSNLASLTSYNTTTKAAGILNGDSSIRLIASRLQSLVAGVIPGGGVSSLADVGIKFTDDGTLSVDDAKLGTALASHPDGVARLFARSGTASDSLVSYGDSSDKTQVGSYALTVSQLATRGSTTGSATAGLTISAGVNDTIGLTIDNVSATITLAPGTYANAGALATQLQAQINGTAAIAAGGSSVTVGASGGVLAITSQRYGSASSVSVNDGNGATGLFGTTSTAAAGLDVAGTLDGVAFTGTGQVATGAASTSAEGLKLTIAGGTIGARGTIDFNRGIAARVDDVLTQFLDPNNGLLGAATDSINGSIKDLRGREADWNTRLVAIRARYTAQYNAMDALVASLNSTSSYLTQQLEALKNSTKSS